MLFPRFRSRDRDVRSDIDRLAAIGEAIGKALDEAGKEEAGLVGRLEDARARAAFLYGDVIDGEIEDDAKGSAMVREAEQLLVRGEKRRDELKAHFALLRELEARIDASIRKLRSDLPPE